MSSPSSRHTHISEKICFLKNLTHPPLYFLGTRAIQTDMNRFFISISNQDLRLNGNESFYQNSKGLWWCQEDCSASWVLQTLQGHWQASYILKKVSRNGQIWQDLRSKGHKKFKVNKILICVYRINNVMDEGVGSPKSIPYMLLKVKTISNLS